MNADSIPKLSTINVKNLRLRAYIGFADWEKEKLQDVVISYSFKYDVKEAVESDDIKDAVDYKVINKKIISTVEGKSFSLMEYLAETIFSIIENTDTNIQEIDVLVEKPHALRFADDVSVKILASERFKQAVIALGSNIRPEEYFEKALTLIQHIGTLLERTEFIATQPLKFKKQPDFLNGAILLLTKKNLSSLQLQLKQIEALLGRVRTKNKNAPRTIDLDVITYNGHIIDKHLYELPFLVNFVKQLQPEIDLQY